MRATSSLRGTDASAFAAGATWTVVVTGTVWGAVTEPANGFGADFCLPSSIIIYFSCASPLGIKANCLMILQYYLKPVADFYVLMPMTELEKTPTVSS